MGGPAASSASETQLHAKAGAVAARIDRAAEIRQAQEEHRDVECRAALRQIVPNPWREDHPGEHKVTVYGQTASTAGTAGAADGSPRPPASRKSARSPAQRLDPIHHPSRLVTREDCACV
jgi:hypothetical protein